MRSQILIATVAVVALLCTATAQARPKHRARDASSLVDLRSDLAASGASASTLAEIDARIDASSRTQVETSSRRRNRFDASTRAEASADVGVRSTRTSPPYGHAYGYWLHGPGSRIEGGAGASGNVSVRGNGQGRGRGRNR